MRRIKNNLTPLYMLIQLTFWSAVCCVISFLSLYLLDHGFTNTVIGYDLAAANLLSVFLLGVLAPKIDRSTKYGPKHIAIVLSLVILTVGIFLIVFENHSSFFTVGLFCIGVMCCQTICSYVNSLAIASLNEKYVLNFGLCRATGSFGYSLISVLIGFLVAKYGSKILPYAILITSVLTIVALLVYPDVRTQSFSQSEKGLSTSEFFKKYRNFTLLLLGLVGIYFGHVLLSNFTLQIIQSKGGGSSEMGIAVAIAALFEIIVLISFDKLSKKHKISSLIGFSSVFFPIKLLCSMLVGSVGAYYFVQLLQMPAWGIMTIASVLYIDIIVDKNDSVKGQSYNMIAISVASILVSFIGGRVIDSYGVSTLMNIGILISAIGAALINVAILKDNPRYLSQ